MFYGQHREDEFLNTLFPQQHIGVCIEVGAYDGISGSNTYFFEKKGWRALCIEPIPSSFQKCNSIRKECMNCCISNEDTEEDKDFHIFCLTLSLDNNS